MPGKIFGGRAPQLKVQERRRLVAHNRGVSEDNASVLHCDISAGLFESDNLQEAPKQKHKWPATSLMKTSGW